MKRKSILLGGIVALALAFAAPASAGKFVVDGLHLAAGASLGAGLSGGAGITKQTFKGQSGQVSESDLTIKMDENGLKKLDYTGRNAGYFVGETTFKGLGGFTGTAGIVAGTVQMNTTVKKKN